MARQTLDDLAASLPNGFHDAELKTVVLDYVKREVRLTLEIWVGDMSPPPGDEREAYRQAELLLSGLVYWVCEAPDAGYPYDEAGGVRIGTGAMQALTRPATTKLPPVPTKAFANWIFVSDWNAFIYLAARNARLQWLS